MEELEEHMLAARRERASAYNERTSRDEAEALEPAAAAVAAALSTLSRGGAPAGEQIDLNPKT